MIIKKYLILACCILLFSGCIQSSEHLTLNNDGSGTYDVEMVLPKGTIQLIDMTMGSMMQAMQQAFAQEGQEPQAPPSMIDQMFTKDEIQKKADQTEAKIKFIKFQREMMDDGLHVHYEIAYESITDLMETGIVSAGVKFRQDSNSNWICSIVPDGTKETQSKDQLKQFDEFKGSAEFNQLDPTMQTAIFAALSDLKFEFNVTMPYPIQKIEGVFEQVGDNSARLYIAGNLLEDQSLIEKLSGRRDGDSIVVWKSGTGDYVEEIDQNLGDHQDIKIDQNSVDIEKTKSDSKITTQEANIKTIQMKNGTVNEGPLIEETDDYIKILIADVHLTFYKDDIESIK